MSGQEKEAKTPPEERGKGARRRKGHGGKEGGRDCRGAPPRGSLAFCADSRPPESLLRVRADHRWQARAPGPEGIMDAVGGVQNQLTGRHVARRDDGAEHPSSRGLRGGGRGGGGSGADHARGARQGRRAGALGRARARAHLLLPGEHHGGALGFRGGSDEKGGEFF